MPLATNDGPTHYWQVANQLIAEGRVTRQEALELAQVKKPSGRRAWGSLADKLRASTQSNRLPRWETAAAAYGITDFFAWSIFHKLLAVSPQTRKALRKFMTQSDLEVGAAQLVSLGLANVTIDHWGTKEVSLTYEYPPTTPAADPLLAGPVSEDGAIAA